jgi:hypothetical protein
MDGLPRVDFERVREAIIRLIPEPAHGKCCRATVLARRKRPAERPSFHREARYRSHALFSMAFETVVPPDINFRTHGPVGQAPYN